MKFLVLLLVLAVAAGWVFLRGRQRKPPPPRGAPQPPAAAAKEATEMLACAHCGVHLPRAEAAFDVAGRPFCTPEHRIAGPV